MRRGPAPSGRNEPIRPLTATILAVLACTTTARAATTTVLHQREHRQVRHLSAAVGTVRFFDHHRWLMRARRTRPVALRELRRAHVWIRVIRRELGETRAALKPRVAAFAGPPAWWLAAADCVHRHESIDWFQRGAFSGGMQFLDSTWHAVGGSGRAADHSPAEQLYRAYLLWRSQGWSPWPNTSRMCGLA